MFLFPRFSDSSVVGTELARSWLSTWSSRTAQARPPRLHQCGFTLIELLVVVALIATLSGLLLGGGRYAFESGRISRARAELAAWSAALENYRTAHGDYPPSLAALDRAPAASRDPWEQPYRYAYKSSVPWTNPSYVLYSAGPDGTASEVLRMGGFPDPSAPGNADNVYANLP